MAKNTEQRQVINKIDLVGEVAEQKLNKDKNKNGSYINGSLVIKTGEFSEIEIKVFAGEKNKDGKPKKAFETLKKFIDGEHLTLASCKTDEERESVAKVRIYTTNKDFTPQFKEDIFKPKGTEEVKTKLTVDLGFGNVSVDNSIKAENYKAEFEVELFVTSVKEEMKQDEATGRVIVNGWTPLYGGKVMPMEVIAGTIIDDEGEEYDFGDDILSQVEEGMTINVWGEINYKTIITKTTKGGGLGKAKVEEHRDYVNDLIMVGATIQEDEEQELDMELIKKAIIERDIEIENVRKEEGSDTKKSKGKGMDKGSSTSSTSGERPKRERPKF